MLGAGGCCGAGTPNNVNSIWCKVKSIKQIYSQKALAAAPAAFPNEDGYALGIVLMALRLAKVETSIIASSKGFARVN